MMDIIERLKFDATRCEATFSKGVASNIEEAVAEIERLRTVEWAAQTVLKTFQDSEAAGYRSKDRQYAIEILGKFLNQQSPLKDER